MLLTFTLGEQCCDKDAAKFYFNALIGSGEFLSRATKSGRFEVPSSTLQVLVGRTRSVQA
jgi:hypothetical protein